MLRAIDWTLPLVPAQLRGHQSQSCPHPQGSLGGRRELGAIHWTCLLVPAQQLLGQQCQSFPFPQSWGKKRKGKDEDGGRGRKGGREQQLAQGLSGGW